MKRETFRHPKLLDLASRLGCSRPEAIGYLQLLWDFTAEYAIQGDIGKHADGAIARACDWQGSADEFVNALLDAGWLDEDETHRLLIHDWADHCERWVKLKLQKINKAIIEPTIEGSTEGDAEGSPSRDQSKPIQTNPNLDAARRVLEHLNKKAGKQFRPGEANLKFILARLDEYDEETLKRVVDDRVSRWATDVKMRDYLRPETLFNQTKCASYVGQLPAAKPGGKSLDVADVYEFWMKLGSPQKLARRPDETVEQWQQRLEEAA